MKKIIILIILCPIFLNAQIISIFPKNESGEIVFSEIIKSDSTPKGILYIRAKSFFANSFKSANDVIQLDDKETGIVIGKGNTKLTGTSYTLHFSLKISCKDNKFKYELYNFTFTTAPSYPYFPNGITFNTINFFDTSEYYKLNGNPNPRLEKIKIAFVDEIELIKNALLKEMIIPKETKKEDW